jgi:hypothetical protein
MKGRIYKTEQGWVVRHPAYVPPHEYELPLHPDDVKQINADAQVFDNIEARISAYPDVDFDVVEVRVIGGLKNFAKLISNTNNEEYPEIEGTLALCNDKVWDDIYDEYSKEQWPAFGGPFTDSMSFIDWLKENYKAPQRIKS